MEVDSVKSDCLSWVIYAVEAHTLFLVFIRDFVVYEYLNVPTETRDLLLTSESKGKFFNQHIKKQYEFHRL